MVRASRGLRTGTRRKLSKKYRTKPTVTQYLREYKETEKVTVMPNPSSQKGMPHIRFKGAIGVVQGKRGSAYVVEVKLGNKKKVITATPEHLVPVS